MPRIRPKKLRAINEPEEGSVLAFDSINNAFKWVTPLETPKDTQFPYDYIIFQEDNITKAFNTKTKSIEFQFLDPVDTLQQLHDSYPVETAVLNLYFKPGNYISSRRLVVKNNRMRFFGSGAPHYYYGTLAWLPDGRAYHRGYANLLFGIDAYVPIDGYNTIFGNNTNRASPSVALYVDLSEVAHPSKEIWTQGFEFINCRFMNGNPGLLHTGVHLGATNVTDNIINSWNHRIQHCSFQFNGRALDISNGTAEVFGFMCHMEDLMFHDNGGDGTKPCINITPDNWLGAFKNVLIEGNGLSTDVASLVISTYGTGGLEIAHIGFGDGNPPLWDAYFSLGRTTTIRHFQPVKGIFISGVCVIQAGALFGIYPYASHALKFIPDPGVGSEIKFLTSADTPTSADRLPQVPMWIDLNEFQMLPTRITAASSPYTLKYTDVLVFVDASGGNITVNIPREYGFIQGTVWTIKRIDTSTNTVRVNIGTNQQTLSAGGVLRITGLGANNSFALL
jgi:hypothetical protein